MQDELTRKFNLRPAGSRALSGPPNVVCFQQSASIPPWRERSREQKGLGYPAASNEAAALRVHSAEEMQMQVTGTETPPMLSSFIPPWATATIFNPECFRGALKSRWQQQSELLHETTATFHSEK
jgi:hypothetical protein